MTGSVQARPVTVSSRMFSVVLVAALITWLPRMFWGFWVDEAGTYWMTCRGVRAAVERTLQFSGQSILYSILVSPFCTDGPFKEFLLRVPSLAAVAIGAVLLYRFAERMLGPGTGALAALVLIGPAPVVEAATEARPYAFALAAAIGAGYALFEWMETRAQRWLAAYVACSILVLYFHYLFGFVLAVFALFALVRGLPARGWVEFAVAELVILASLVPLRSPMELALRHRTTGAKAVLPGLPQLGVALFPPEVMIGAGLALVLLLALYTRSVGRPAAISRASLFLIISWAFLGTIVFFTAARAANTSLFASRYLLFETPGFALLIAWLGSGLRDRRAATIACISIFSACALNAPNLIQLWQGSPREWKTPLAMARQTEAPTFVTSGIVESNSVDWEHVPAKESYLYAPLTAYPLQAPVVPLPYFLTKAGTASVREALGQPLGSARRLVLLSRSSEDVVPWFEQELGSRGYRSTTLYAREIVVVEFDRD
jgi:dolichyl-phosphate-mannose-protein mannosyltransferase